MNKWLIRRIILHLQNTNLKSPAVKYASASEKDASFMTSPIITLVWNDVKIEKKSNMFRNLVNDQLFWYDRLDNDQWLPNAFLFPKESD